MLGGFLFEVLVLFCRDSVLSWFMCLSDVMGLLWVIVFALGLWVGYLVGFIASVLLGWFFCVGVLVFVLPLGFWVLVVLVLV